MIIKEDIHIDPALQANFPEFVIARGKVPKQSLYSRGQENIKAMGEGSRRNNIKDQGLTPVIHSALHEIAQSFKTTKNKGWKSFSVFP